MKTKAVKSLPFGKRSNSLGMKNGVNLQKNTPKVSAAPKLPAQTPNLLNQPVNLQKGISNLLLPASNSLLGRRKSVPGFSTASSFPIQTPLNSAINLQKTVSTPALINNTSLPQTFLLGKSVSLQCIPTDHFVSSQGPLLSGLNPPVGLANEVKNTVPGNLLINTLNAPASQVFPLQSSQALPYSLLQKARMARHADETLTSIAQLTPGLAQKHGWQGMLFDMDNTIKPLGSTQIPSPMITALRQLQQAGIKLGIVSSNPFYGKVQETSQLLNQQGLHIPIIWDANKPHKASFQKGLAELNLQGQPEKVAMVGDGLINDVMGAKFAGLGTIRAKWFDCLSIKVLGPIFDGISIPFNPIFNKFKSQQKNMVFQ